MLPRRQLVHLPQTPAFFTSTMVLVLGLASMPCVGSLAELDALQIVSCSYVQNGETGRGPHTQLQSCCALAAGHGGGLQAAGVCLV